MAFTYNGGTGYNLIADWPGGDTANTVMVGAHLDSVSAGAGSTTTAPAPPASSRSRSPSPGRLDARQAPALRLVGRRGARPGRLDALRPQPDQHAERAQIDAYYNFDMIGSPNPGYFVYDGDNSDGTGLRPGPSGSAYLEQVLVDYFAGIGVPTRGTDFDGRSDYGPFIQYGIPAGGTFTGAEGRKTAAQVQLWGGTTAPFDPCYHSPCDDRTTSTPPPWTATPARSRTRSGRWRRSVTSSRRHRCATRPRRSGSLDVRRDRRMRRRAPGSARRGDRAWLPRRARRRRLRPDPPTPGLASGGRRSPGREPRTGRGDLVRRHGRHLSLAGVRVLRVRALDAGVRPPLTSEPEGGLPVGRLREDQHLAGRHPEHVGDAAGVVLSAEAVLAGVEAPGLAVLLEVGGGDR